MNTCAKNQGNRGGSCFSGVSVLQKVTFNLQSLLTTDAKFEKLLRFFTFGP